MRRTQGEVGEPALVALLLHGLHLLHQLFRSRVSAEEYFFLFLRFSLFLRRTGHLCWFFVGCRRPAMRRNKRRESV